MSADLQQHREAMAEALRELIPEPPVDRALMFAELFAFGVHITDKDAPAVTTDALQGHVRDVRAHRMTRLLFSLARLSGEEESAYTAKA